MLRQEDIRALLQTKTVGRVLFVHQTLPSTNDLAKRMADTADNGTVIVAAQQTAGRGRRGRSFFSPNGCGIYMTVILKETLPPEKTGLLTSAVAVAVARAIESLVPAAVHIKWVNDLLINGKKICGILCEGTAHGAVIGIGVNVSTVDFPPELEAIASSILRECGTAPDRAALVAAILNQLEAMTEEIKSGAFLSESRRRSAVLGKTVTVMRGEESFSANALDIDDHGALIIQTDGGIQTLFSGEVSLRL